MFRKQLCLVVLLAFARIAIAAEPGASLPASPLEGWYNVKDFGAKGDGRTTDTEAIQKAINAARRKGGVVWLPPGDYAVASLDLTGISRGVTFCGAAPGATNLVPIQSGVPVIDLTGSYFTIVRDFSIMTAPRRPGG